MRGGVVFGIRFENFHMMSVTAGNTLLIYSDIEMDDSQDLSDVLGYTNGCQDPANKRYHAKKLHRMRSVLEMLGQSAIFPLW